MFHKGMKQQKTVTSQVNQGKYLIDCQLEGRTITMAMI